MNPWDVVTWLCSAGLAISGVLIFGFFLKDARQVLNRDLRHSADEPSEPADDELR